MKGAEYSTLVIRRLQFNQIRALECETNPKLSIIYPGVTQWAVFVAKPTVTSALRKERGGRLRRSHSSGITSYVLPRCRLCFTKFRSRTNRLQWSDIFPLYSNLLFLSTFNPEPTVKQKRTQKEIEMDKGPYRHTLGLNYLFQNQT